MTGDRSAGPSPNYPRPPGAQERSAETGAAEGRGSARPDLVVVPCGGRKLQRLAPAGELYAGSYHRACRRAAAALSPRQTLILSARHGLVGLEDVLAPYDTTFGDPDAVTADHVAAQADQRGLRTVAGVAVLAGRRYVAATRLAWPHALDPLAGSRGMGEQLARLAEIARVGPDALPRPGAQPIAPAVER